jgi:hypothetical protein
VKVIDGLRVTKLTQHEEGYWSANVSLNGTTVRVDNSTGAWAAPEGKGCALDARAGRHVLPPVALVLQRKVRREEKRQNGRDPARTGPRETSV